MSHPSATGRDQQGFAMLTTMLIMIIVTLLVAGSISYSVGSLTISRHDQDWNAALSAAEGGIDDYLYRLNQNSNYWQYGVVPGVCPAAPAICPKTPPELPTPNQAFNFSGGKPVYVPIPGLANDAMYHYDVDVSTLGVDGTIKVLSTGKVRNATRSVRTTIRQRGFLDFLYFTNYETVDPTFYSLANGYPYNSTDAQTNCAFHSYDGRNALCRNIVFRSGDVVKGPLHTNDALEINGTPQFQGATTDSWNVTPKRWIDTAGGGSVPGFLNGPVTDPKYAAALPMPPSNTTIKAQADPAIPITGVGCMYTGPTEILVRSDGKMNVTSPKTKNVNAGCGPGNGLALPVNGVIFVQGVPTAPADLNYSAPCATLTNALGYPKKDSSNNQDTTTYGCGDGDVFISGTLKGQITVAAEHNIIITNNLTYQNGFTGTDVIGLVANGSVNIYHPIHDVGGGNFDNNNDAQTDPVIQAAIVALAHSFVVPNWDQGNALGTINLTGAIGQQYRGAVGTFGGGGGTGYIKNYVYDQRLQYLTPPHFLQPTVSAWQIKVWAEEKAAYPGY